MGSKLRVTFKIRSKEGEQGCAGLAQSVEHTTLGSWGCELESHVEGRDYVKKNKGKKRL